MKSQANNIKEGDLVLFREYPYNECFTKIGLVTKILKSDIGFYCQILHNEKRNNIKFKYINELKKL